jgi:formylglycine-generating enzyme
MVEVPSGSFVMGSDANYPEESPAHEKRVAAFVIYQHPVANAEFRCFVSEAGYRTTATPSAEDISGGDAAVLVAGSLIFRATEDITGWLPDLWRGEPPRLFRRLDLLATRPR